MGVKVYKPTTPGRRKASVRDFSVVTKTTPEKSLLTTLKSHSGRNNTGKITIRHRGGRVKRRYRIIDFARLRFDEPAKIIAIEYDPNRGPFIALIEYPDQTRAYILHAKGMEVGDTVVSSQNKIEAVTGARMPLEHIPVGMFVYNVEMQPLKGGQVVRSAGQGAQLQNLEGDYAQLKLPSGEVRLFDKKCLATIGKIGNSDHQFVRLGKAGRKRKKGWRPTVRGKAMNPVDHPHGGGEGRNSIGLKVGPKTPWGKRALGVKTRKRGKWTNKFIVKSRKKK